MSRKRITRAIDADQEGYMKALNDIGTRMLTKAWDENLSMFASHIKKAKADAKKEAKKNADRRPVQTQQSHAWGAVLVSSWSVVTVPLGPDSF